MGENRSINYNPRQGPALFVCEVAPTPPTPITLGDGLTLFRYEALPPGELPELCLVDHHALAVIDLHSAAIFEGKIGETSYPPQIKGYGSVTLVPAGVSHQVRWHQPISLTILYLRHSFLAQMAADHFQVTNLTLLPRQQAEDRGLYHLTMALQTSLLSSPNPSSNAFYHQYLVTALTWRLISHHAVQSLHPLPSPSLNPSPQSLNWTLHQVNNLVLIHTGEPLSDTQTGVLTGVLRGHRYGKIAQQHHRSVGHIKTTAAELWKTLSQVLGQPVRKANLRSTLQHHGLLSNSHALGQKQHPGEP